MVDRFREFQADLAVPNSDQQDVEYHSMEMRPLAKDTQVSQGEEFMEAFYQEVGEIKHKMSKIRDNINSLTTLLDKQLSAVKKTDEKTSEVQIVIDETNALCMQIKSRLKELEKQVAQEKGERSVQARIRRNTYNTISKQFVDLMTTYQEKQTQFKRQTQEKTTRQLRIVNPNISEEETQRIIEQGASSVFVDALASKYNRVYNEVCERHQEILKLESSIQELHQLFVDMAVLVEAQGELLDQIEHSVSQSVAYTEKAVVELKEGTKLQKKSRKKMCFLMILFLVIIIVIVAPLIAL
eukprot:TRINITY_DN3644_c0_g1_i1.p1 TRINITY_DN3644_c0_g1~~TRINITY_DN3644_c0_g1_i1.p1  ORF type:complete len:297 (-),score=70.39 TRINITY_DN3644_c0_g1_i1:395-1285(-)